MKNALILITSMTLSLILSSMVTAYAQELAPTPPPAPVTPAPVTPAPVTPAPVTSATAGNTTTTASGAGISTQMTLEIRGIDSLTSPNLVGLIYTPNGAAAQKVDVNSSIIMPNQGNDTTDPERMVNVSMALNNPVPEGTEVTACVLEIAQNPIDNTILCNVAFANPTSTGAPQRIVVTL